MGLNPSNGIFNIDLTNEQGDYDKIEVLNILGVKVYENRLNPKRSNTVDLSNATTGCYFAKVSGNTGSNAFQLIKNPDVIVASSEPRSTGEDCIPDKKEVSYQEDSINYKIKMKDKLRNWEQWNNKHVLFSMTVGYKRINGHWKRRRTWIKTGITGSDGINPGHIYNHCTGTPININWIKEHRKRRVKVKWIFEWYNGAEGYIGINDNDVFTLHNQGTITTIKDYYNLKNKD